MLEVRLTAAWPGGESTFTLTGDEYVLGREPTADIVIPVAFVSRRHARLVREETGYRYMHLGTNPTLLAGTPVAERLIRDGDVLLIGPEREQVRLAFQLVAPAVVEPAGAAAAAASVALPPEGTLTIGRDKSNGLVLDSPLVSRRHATLTRDNHNVVLRDAGSTNGTYVNGRAVQKHRLVPGDVIRIGSDKLLYRDGELLRYDERRNALLQAYHLKVAVGPKVILDDVSFWASPGQVTAVAGVSGAGKSTLLNALSGLVPASEGRVLLNDSDLYEDYSALRFLIGYVPQADIVHKELPLERALRYAARLRFPTDASEEYLVGQVRSVIRELELEGERHLVIRRMSGGQQKRASLAVELLAKPPLLLLDEPTTGLDPGLRRQLMELLRDLSREGRTVVLVTHDPDTVAYCDEMVFLASGGKVAFAGPPVAALAYFEAPDYVEIYRKVERERSPTEWQEMFLRSPRFHNEVASRLPLLQEDTRARDAVAQTEGTAVGPAPVSGDDLARVYHLSRRYGEVMARDLRNLALLLLQAPVLAFILGLVSSRHALTASASAGEANKVLLLLATSAVWLGTINSAREVVKELPIYVRERLMGIGPVPYVLSKVAVLSILCLVQSWLLLVVLALRVDLPSDGVLLPGPLEMYLSIALTSLTAMAMGLLVSAASSSQERATSVVPLVLIPQIVLAGVIFKLSGLAEVLSFISIAKWSVEVLGATAALPDGGYAANVPHQLSRWLVLVVMATVFLATTVWLLARKDTSALARP